MGKIYSMISVAFGVIISIAAIFLKGRSQGRADARAKQDADYRETRERMDAVSTDGLSDDDVARRLRDHAKR